MICTGQVLGGLARFRHELRRNMKSGETYSVSPERVGYELSSRVVSNQVLSPLQSLTSVFGMGTGGPSALITLTPAIGGFEQSRPFVS